MQHSEHIEFDLAQQDQAQELAMRFGLHTGQSGKRNRIFVHPSIRSLAGHLNFGGEHNQIAFGEGCSFHGEIVCMGDSSRTVIHGHQHTLNLQAFLYRDAVLEIGAGTNAYGLRVWVSEERRMTIGQRCLFSEGVTMRTTDHHSIFEIATLKLLNEPADLAIGDYVWVNQDVGVLKGVTIGTGAIIGAKALVTRSVPELELWSGVPARMIRQNVSWVEPNPASDMQIGERAAELQQLAKRSGLAARS